MFWGKAFVVKPDIVVAICDENLLDKKIKTKEFDIEINKNFYGDKLIDESLAITLMKKSTIGNLIGEDIVNLAEKNGFITRENIIFINGVPHAQFVKI